MQQNDGELLAHVWQHRRSAQLGHSRVDHVTNRCEVTRAGQMKTHLETEDEPSVIISDRACNSINSCRKNS